ncbi:hypothetical protein [Clostridium estertheticum]|uniref:hypothetical protein n=1 Tax=Clostridium estertheticum TaxID=238834 RepID=UPI001C0E61E6|nr:hypothetical protein [Clostridium estertheticum]MBU3186625.1 hypothetical protein [Clostridium estertheticum]
MDIKPIGLSFKNTPEDIELYKWIISHSNKSGFIKDILRAAKGDINIPKEEAKSSKIDKTELIDFNF